MGIIASLRDRIKKTLASREGRAASAQFIARPSADHALVVGATSPRLIPRWRQFRYSGLIFSGSEQRIIVAALLVFVIAGSAAAWMFARSRIARAPAGGGKVVEAVVGSPKGINPLYASTNDPDADLSALVFAGVLKRVDGKLVNDLAESTAWSSDGKQLTVTLKDNITFHDGTPLTSDDVVFTLQSAKDPAWRSPYAGSFRDAAFDAPDERTVVITLGSPDASFEDALTIGILPAHVWSDVSPQNAQLADANIRPIGAGPFMVSSFRRGSNGALLAYDLTRFNGYRGEKPYLDDVEFRFYPDPASAEDAVRGGQADAVAFVSGGDVKKFPMTTFATSSISLPEETIAFFNVNDAILGNARIREALALAVDRGDVVTALDGYASPIGGPYPDGPASAAASSTEERLAAARKLLDAAGWTIANGSDVRMRAGNASSTKTDAASSTSALALTITVPDVPDLVAVADVLAQRWSLLNARVTVSAEPANVLLQNISRSRTNQIIVWNVLLSPTEDLYPIWWSGQAEGSGLNLSNLKDRDVDAAIKDVGAAGTADALAAAKAKLTAAILARTPAVFLARPTYAYVVSKRVNGVSKSFDLLAPADRFQNITHWYVKTTWGWK
jgi:peptide/nickel transport system substrate-binding protein